MKANIRAILQDCIEIGVESGYARAYKHTDNPTEMAMRECIELAIWYEIDIRFDFETQDRDLFSEIIEGFDRLETKRNKCNGHQDVRM